jgi:uncharacterized protein YndB with AHSA1/START domain
MAIQFTLSEQIAAPKEKVFAALTDFSTVGQWMKGFVRIDRIKGEGFNTGDVWRETRKMFGREATEEFEVTGLVPNKEIRLYIDGTKGSSKKVVYNFQYLLEDKDGGTLLTLNGEVMGMKGFAGFMFKLFKGVFKKALLKDIRDMKAWIEKN